MCVGGVRGCKSTTAVWPDHSTSTCTSLLYHCGSTPPQQFLNNFTTSLCGPILTCSQLGPPLGLHYHAVRTATSSPLLHCHFVSTTTQPHDLHYHTATYSPLPHCHFLSTTTLPLCLHYHTATWSPLPHCHFVSTTALPLRLHYHAAAVDLRFSSRILWHYIEGKRFAWALRAWKAEKRKSEREKRRKHLGCF